MRMIYKAVIAVTLLLLLAFGASQVLPDGSHSSDSIANNTVANETAVKVGSTLNSNHDNFWSPENIWFLMWLNDNNRQSSYYAGSGSSQGNDYHPTAYSDGSRTGSSGYSNKEQSVPPGIGINYYSSDSDTDKKYTEVSPTAQTEDEQGYTEVSPTAQGDGDNPEGAEGVAGYNPVTSEDANGGNEVGDASANGDNWWNNFGGSSQEDTDYGSNTVAEASSSDSGYGLNDADSDASNNGYGSGYGSSSSGDDSSDYSGYDSGYDSYGSDYSGYDSGYDSYGSDYGGYDSGYDSYGSDYGGYDSGYDSYGSDYGGDW